MGVVPLVVARARVPERSTIAVVERVTLVFTDPCWVAVVFLLASVLVFLPAPFHGALIIRIKSYASPRFSP